MRGAGAAPERAKAASPSSAAAWDGVPPAALTCTTAASPKKAAIRRLQSLHGSPAMAARLSASGGGRAGRPSSCRGRAAGSGCLGGLWDLKPWRFPRLGWAELWAAGADNPAAGGVMDWSRPDIPRASIFVFLQ